MDDLALFIQHDEDWETETSAVVQSLHQCCCLLCLGFTLRLTGIVVHMGIDKVVADDLADGRVVRDEVRKP